MLDRVYGIAHPDRTADPRYIDGLRAAVSAAFDYGLLSIELGEQGTPAIPAILLAQARLAARNQVSLDTVLRRYVAGHTLLGDFLVEEANQTGLNGLALKGLLRDLAALLEGVLTAISEEHNRHGEGRLHSAEQRRIRGVERLLAGQLVDTSEIAYDFDARHLGVIVSGPEAEKHLRELAMTLDRRLLLIKRDQGVIWAWLGAALRETDPRDLEHLVLETWPAQLFLAAGEPASGFAGWRLTHRQALAALPIAMRSPKRLALYADVALLASALQDDLLATSLRSLYLAPLANERDGGAGLRETLRAYFAAECNASSTAAALGVSRQTVINRVRTIENRLNRPLHTCMTGLEIALQLDEFGSLADPLHPVVSGG